MRILQICSKPPLPAIDGGCMAMNVLTQGLLEQEKKVKVITIATEKHPFNINNLPKDYVENTAIESVFIDTKVSASGAFINLFSKESYNISRFYNLDFEELLLKSLKEQDYDVIFLEGLYVVPYLEIIRSNTNAKIIYRAHNIEFEIWERSAATSVNPFKKWYLSSLARKLKNYEISILNKVDAIASITEKDKQQLTSLGCTQPIVTIPFGVDLGSYSKADIKKENSLFYIGSMDWLPNLEAINWFLKEVLPQLSASFYLAGKNMPEELIHKKQENLIVVGEVKSAVEFINAHHIMVVPLFSGSGMRIKIIEAMALGKVVIATSIAAEGINCTHQKDILIANTAKEYITAIEWCFANTELVNEIGANAKKMIALHYDNKVIVNNLVALFKN